MTIELEEIPSRETLDGNVSSEVVVPIEVRGNNLPSRGERLLPIVVLFEPAADEFSYESKFIPLLGKYLDPLVFEPFVVGSSGLKGALPDDKSVGLEIPIKFVGHRGPLRFVLYVASLALSALLLVKATKLSRSKIIVTMAGHCYSGFIVAVMGKLMKRRTIIRISEPTRLLLRRNHRPRIVYALATLTEKISLSLSDAIFSVRDMSDYCAIPPSKDWIIRQGVDLKGIEDSRPVKLREHLSPAIVTVSRLDSEKGIDRLIDSIALLIHKLPDAGCLIVGWGPEMESLRKRVAEKGLIQHVSFVGYVPPGKVASFLKACNIFVLPSELEGVPSAVLEAMASGLPVVMCLQTGDFAKSVIRAGSALTVPPTPQAIADAIEWLWFNESERVKLSELGLEYVRANYDEAESRKRFFELTSRLTHGSPARDPT